MPRKKSKSIKKIQKAESQAREESSEEKRDSPRTIPETMSSVVGMSEMDSDQFIEKSAEQQRNVRGLKDLAKDIVASYDARVTIVGDIINDTHRMMADFKGRREHMSKELQEVLAKCESLRKKDFDRMMADIVATQNEREGQVKEMLESFRKEEEAVAEKLRNLLKKGEEIRIKDFKKMMLDIKEEQEKRTKKTSESVTEYLQGMQKEVHTMLDNFKKERMSVATAWHEVLGLFRAEKLGANPGANPADPADAKTIAGEDEEKNKKDEEEEDKKEDQ